jgi:hypothetical protein
MPTTLGNIPLGANGSLVIVESAGVLTLTFAEALPADGINVGVTLSVSAATLVNAWAAGTTNATLKAGLTELGVLLAGLPV